jgi:hypothetical protein
MDWQTLANIAAVFGAISGGATFLLIAISRHRNEANSRLFVRMENPSNDVFEIVIEYRPQFLNQGLYAEIGSLGSNPIYLLPSPEHYFHTRFANPFRHSLTWPKKSGEWTSGRLRPIVGSDVLRKVFRVVPQYTDGGGWIHVRIYTQTPIKRTLIRRRVAVSVASLDISSRTL